MTKRARPAVKPLSRIWLAVATLGLVAARAGATANVVPPASAAVGGVHPARPWATSLFPAGRYPGTVAHTRPGAAGAPLPTRPAASAPAARA